MDAYDRFIAELTAKRYFDWRGFCRFLALWAIAYGVYLIAS